jgi:hypothetical protein
LKHEEIMSMMDRRSYERRKNKVSDEAIKQWLEEEEFEHWNAFEMDKLEEELSKTYKVQEDKSFGNIPLERPDGVFRGMSIQLNSIATSKTKNRKARRLKNAIRKYNVQFVGMGEVGVNWDLAKEKRLLALFPDLGNAAKSMTAHNKHESFALHQQGGVGTLALGTWGNSNILQEGIYRLQKARTLD